MKLCITLGPGLQPTPYGDVVVLDWRDRRVVDEFRYRHAVYEQSHKGLCGASWSGDHLLVASEAELLEFHVAPLRLKSARTLNFLNDVHHIASDSEHIWVCNTGLDCIEELDAAWSPVETHHLVRPFGRDATNVASLLYHDFRKSWKRLRGRYEHYTHLTKRPAFRNVVKLCRQDAYRRNGSELRFSDFRPHVLHPNHVLPVGNDLWITLWRTGEIVSLRQERVLLKDLGRPHDGIIANDKLYVTDCKENRLLVYDIRGQTPGGKLAEVRITEHKQEGFLRGIAVGEGLIWVGLTSRRGAPTQFKTARIVALDAQTLQRVDQWVVPSEYGMQIFSILNAERFYL